MSIPPVSVNISLCTKDMYIFVYFTCIFQQFVAISNIKMNINFGSLVFRPLLFSTQAKEQKMGEAWEQS